MSSKLKKWYVILGMTLGGLAVCFLLVAAGGLVGGMAGYAAAHRGGVIGLPGPWQELRPHIPQGQETPKTSPQVPPEMMLEPSSGQLRGAVVAEVDSGGPADQAGMETGDIIIAVNNKAMDENQDLAALIGSHKAGDEVVVTIVRPGADPELIVLEVTLDSDTNEEGEEVAHLGIQYRSVSSGMGLMPLGRGWRSGGGPRTD